MTYEHFTLGLPRHCERPHGDRPEVKMGGLVITGSTLGGVLAIGLGGYLWFALPELRPFLLGALAVGGVFGAALWWKHHQ